MSDRSRRKLPLGEGDVPDKALQELLVAFASDQPTDAVPIDLEDPAIDIMLGLKQAVPVDAVPKDAVPNDAVPVDAVPVDAVPVDAAPKDAAPVDGMPDDARPTAPVPVAKTTIKIGGEDDLPDALYLDEEAGDRLRGGDRSTEASIHSERTTILIADDDFEGASGGIPIATGASASMDPRLRARRIAVKRAVGRRRLRWFVLAGVVVVLVTGVLAALGSSLFAVQRGKITISGGNEMSQTDLAAAVDRLAGHPVLLINTHSIEAQLKRSPWVRDARVTTSFPHSASIEILDRIPLATYQGSDSKFRIIDIDGVVVDVIDGQPIEFMLITGPGVNASAGTSSGVAFTHAAELVQALSPAVRSRTASVTVSDTGALGLVFHSGAKVVFGAPTQLLDKLTRLEAFLKRSEGAQCTTTLDVSTVEPGCSQR